MKIVDNLQYNVIFRSEPEGGYTAVVPSLPGCISYGETLEEAKELVLDAITGYLISLKKHREPIPNDTDSFISSLPIEANKTLTHA